MNLSAMILDWEDRRPDELEAAEVS